MKLSKKLEKALNDQIRKEYEAAYVYNGMRIYLDDAGLRGASSWMTKQTQEELEHAEAFIQHVKSMDGKVVLEKVEGQKTDYKDLLEVLEAAYKHEQMITKSISEILDLAMAEKQYATENFLRKFVDEQVEEEENFRDLIDLVKFVGNDKAGLLKVDSGLGKR